MNKTRKKRLEKLVITGAEYLEDGNPLKDAMDQDDIEDAILLLAEILTAGLD